MNELITVPEQTGELDIMTLGKLLVESRYFQDAGQMAQAVVKVLAGRELGFGPIASMTGIHIVQGRPTLGADLLAKAVKRSGRYNYRVVELSDTRCELAFFERDGDKWAPIGTSPFTVEDAKRAGTKNLDKYPRNMLFARAMSNGVKWFCPDAIGLTVYDPSELPADDGPALTMVDTSTGEITKAQPIITQAEQPNGADNGYQAEQPPVEVVDPHAVTDAQRRMFHALGKKIYGQEWGDVGKAMIREMTGGSEHTSDMFKAQMTRLIDQLKAEEASLMTAEAMTAAQATAELFGDAS